MTRCLFVAVFFRQVVHKDVESFLYQALPVAVSFDSIHCQVLKEESYCLKRDKHILSP